MYRLNRPSGSRVVTVQSCDRESSDKSEIVVFQLFKLPIGAENDVIVDQ